MFLSLHSNISCCILIAERASRLRNARCDTASLALILPLTLDVCLLLPRHCYSCRTAYISLVPAAMTAYTPLPTSTAQQPSSRRFNLPLPWRYPPSSGNTTASNYEQPGLWAAVTARPLRLAAWLAALVLALLVVSGSFGQGPASPHIARIGNYAADQYGNWAGRKGPSWRGLPQNEGLLDPELVKDSKTGFLMPPDVYPAALNP